MTSLLFFTTMTSLLFFLAGLLAGILSCHIAHHKALRRITKERDEIRKNLITAQMRRLILEKALEGAVDAFDQVSSENEDLREDKLHGWGIPSKL